MIWHSITNPADPELDQLAQRYNLHPLHIEDCRNRSQVAKLEENPGYLFLVLKPVEVQEDGVHIVDLDVILGPDFVITVEEDPCPRTRELLEKIRYLGNGQSADQIFYKIVDVLVDSYPPIIDHYVEIIDQLEADVLDHPDPKMLQKILVTKRALLELRRVMSQTREATGHLLRSQSPLIGKPLAPFFRDVYDHVARNLDLLETERDLLTGTLDIYLSSVANRTNQVMKVLAVMSTIALPSIVISGFFGMNLKQMPFSENPNGPYIVIAMMAAVTFSLLILLRRLKWI